VARISEIEALDKDGKTIKTGDENVNDIIWNADQVLVTIQNSKN